MKSMTGFARVSFAAKGARYRVELRSVNSRFLDVKIRLPFHDGELESQATALLRKRLARGRVDLWVHEEGSVDGQAHLLLDTSVAVDVGQVLQDLARHLGSDLATAAQLLPPFKELVTTGTIAESPERWKALHPALEQALERLVEERLREGQGLLADLRTHLQTLVGLTQRVEELAAGEPARAQQRLVERLNHLGVGDTLDAARLTQEVAILADKADISEELARLRIHVGQFDALLGETKPVGRRVEFMLQELQRELNTIASKTTTAETTTLVVEAKGALEKMREQAQNVE
ncbi:MAG: YicC family protein [Deltaproteobacteria bacterium]|nr:YicC family protein [Deltaproteobacteria bacterium]